MAEDEAQSLSESVTELHCQVNVQPCHFVLRKKGTGGEEIVTLIHGTESPYRGLLLLQTHKSEFPT